MAVNPFILCLVLSQTQLPNMDRVQLDLDAVLDRRISTLEAAYIVTNSETCQRFLRANGVISDASFCQTCNVSIWAFINVANVECTLLSSFGYF